jgi:drug/metabolite transporter (DMT)-like permease
MIAIGLALVSSVAWGFADFFAGLRSRRLPVTSVVLFVLAGGTASSFIAALIGGAAWPGPVILLPALLAGLASLTAFLSFYRALALGPMSIVAPIGGTYPIVPVAVGLALGERPTALQLLGMVLVLAGVILATYTSAGSSTRRVGRVAVALSVTAALASGAALIGISSAAAADPYWAMVLVRGTSATLVTAFLLSRWFAARGRRGADSRPARHVVCARDVAVLLAIGTLDTFATGLFGYAATFGYLSVIAVITSLFPLITIGLARATLGERVQAHQNVGTAAALAGVALIVLG